MDPQFSSQRRGAIALVIFFVLVLGIASGLLIATGLDWIPRISAESGVNARMRGNAPIGVEPSDFLISTQESFREIVNAVRPAVVSIMAEGVEVGTSDWPFEFEDPFEFFFDMPDPLDPRNQDRNQDPEPRQFSHPTMSSGSGFIVDAEGHILTNSHVVAGATDITIVMDDGGQHDAYIVGTDPETDVAVLKIDADQQFPYITMGDSTEIQVGDWVMAVGNPFGSLAGTVTVGIVSATNREYLQLPGDTYYKDFIQTDAAINLGNSGGPLVDVYGRAVGINTAITAQGSGIGFAIPINLARFVYDGIVGHGEVVRGWIGVTIQNLDTDMASALGLSNNHGALITDVREGDPADEAGLQPRDVLLKVDGERILSNATASRIIASLPVGEPADFLVWRDGVEITITITPSTRDPELLAQVQEPELEPENPRREGPFFGIDVDELSVSYIQDYRIPEDVDGVIITGVEPSSIAWDKGMIEGMVIVAINDQSVRNLDDYDNLILEAKETWDKNGTPMMIRYMAPSPRGDWAPLYVAIPFE